MRCVNGLFCEFLKKILDNTFLPWYVVENSIMNVREQKQEYTNLCAEFLFFDEEGICVLVLNGSMDTEPIIKLQSEIEGLGIGRTYDFIIDVNNVQYISSTGLGFLLYLMKIRRNFLFISYPPDVVMRSIALLNLDEVFMFYRTFEELRDNAAIPDIIVQILQKRLERSRRAEYRKRWVKILRDYLAHMEVVQEIQKMGPYIQQADYGDSITVPSEEKYACILYKFFDRIFNKVIRASPDEIDDWTIELIAKELMTNAVKHGYNYRKNGVVEANYAFDDGTIEINVIDYGRGFSPSPGASSALPSAGLKILRRIFDEIIIAEAPKKKIQGLVLGNGTMVTLKKHIGKRKR
jgi:anti-anti-sigma factor